MNEPKPFGRPTLFREEFAQQLIDYFNIDAYTEKVELNKDGNPVVIKVANKFPTLARFATMIGVTRETLHDWATSKKEDGELKYPDFSYAYKRTKDYQEAILVEGTMLNVFNAPFSIFTAKNVLGWRDRTEQEITGKDGESLMTAIQVSFVQPKDVGETA
jgi:hypothetical protein